MPIVSSMIKLTKIMENIKNGVYTVRKAYIFLGGSLCFILDFLLDFRKYNLVIFVIRSIISYQGLIIFY